MATESIDQPICLAEAGNPKSLRCIQDELNAARHLAMAAFMASTSLGGSEGAALSRLIMTIEEKLDEVKDGLEAISHREKAA